MPKSRLPQAVWFENIRPYVWKRDHFKCTNCHNPVRLEQCHIDHIVSGKLGSNQLSNLRTLCLACHSLRECNRHRGLTSKAIENGVIPPNWRHLTWEN